jgi:hypothetical protein
LPKRRPLVAGLKNSSKADPRKESEFVYGKKDRSPKAKQRTAPAEPEKAPPPAPPPAELPSEVIPDATAARPAGRASITTRLKADVAAALKRASLERQLAGLTPHTVQDIIEEVVEPWLKRHGYLK